MRSVTRALLLSACLLLLIPAAARASATVSEGTCPGGSGLCLFYTGSGNEFDAYDFTPPDGNFHFSRVYRDDVATNPRGVPIVPAGGCFGEPDGGAGCPQAGVSRLIINAGGGDDWLAKHLNCGCALPITADMGPGNDLLRGGTLADVMHGGDGNDFFAGYGGNDTMDGGAGDDEFDPATGADDVHGGPGYDKITYYKNAAQPVSVTLDDLANDGEATEHDNIHGDVEDITGGDGNDTLAGDGGANVLKGDLSGDAANGNDDITGGAGADSLYGQGGNDIIHARDGEPDTVDCGPGNDSAITDTIDTVRNCETVDAAAPPVSDADHDGIAAPLDCDDANPAIHPGAVDVPGNAIDEDCAGGPAPFPTVDATIGFTVGYARTFTIFRTLYVRKARAGQQLVVRCKGRGCPFRRKTRTVKADAPKLSVMKGLKRKRLRVGAKLQVRVIQAGHIGRVDVFTVRKGKPPKRRELCLPPGATAPVRCT